MRAASVRLARVVRSVVNASGENACDPNYVPSSDPAYDRITLTEYDLRGNVIAVTDPSGLATRTYYDEANREMTGWFNNYLLVKTNSE